MTQQINRRTVTKGIAWSVPAVALASAAPAFASSPPKVYPDGSIEVACKLPGASCEDTTGIKWGYTLSLRLCTDSLVPVEVTFGTATITLNGVPYNWEIYTGRDPQGAPVTNLTLDAEGCQDIFIYANAGDSANSALSGSVPYTWVTVGGETYTGSGSIPVAVASTSPCKDCAPADPADATTTQTMTAVAAAEEAPVDTSSVEETPAEASVEEAPTEVVETEAVEPPVTETEEALVEADVQEPVEQTEVFEETN